MPSRSNLSAFFQSPVFNLIAQEQQPIEIIKNRQTFIKKLVNDPEYFAQVKQLVSNIAAYEKSFISGLFSMESIFSQDAITKILLSPCYLLPLLRKLPNLLHEKAKRNDTLQLLKPHLFAGLFGAIAIGLEKIEHRSPRPPSQGMGVAAGALVGFGIGVIFSFFLQSISIKRNEIPQLSLLFSCAQAVAQTIRKTTQLEALLSSATPYFNNLFPHAPKEWFSLIQKAQLPMFNITETLTPTTDLGKALNVFYNLEQSINEVGTVLRFYGEIDAYLSIAQFMLEQQNAKNSHNEPVGVCFAQFAENKSQSQLHAKNFWHPIIEHSVARPSSLYLGGDNKARNMVITGPNAGGKSVNLKALLTNIILSQTFGVACAESWILTPFSTIIARLKGTDDTASDKSKFMLEAISMATILKEVTQLPTDEHAFIVTDELFTGTEVNPAINLSMELCKEISTHKNVMYVLATHYKELCSLEQLTNHSFESYRVSVFKDPNTLGLTYPFSLSKGIGCTNVAFDIFLELLEKENFKDESFISIIKRAKAEQERKEKEDAQ